MKCTCAEWQPNINKINAPITLQTHRSGGKYQYDGVPFLFCPWCGKKLVEDTGVCDKHQCLIEIPRSA